MRKIILSTVLIFCFGLVYGQPQGVTAIVGPEQETVFNQIWDSQSWGITEFYFGGRQCRVFVKRLTSPGKYETAIREVLTLLSEQEAELNSIPPGTPLEFYFIANKKFTPKVEPRFPRIENYDGLKEHQVMVLTHMSDWSPVCKIITSLTPSKRGYLKNRLIYAMGRVIHEYRQDPFYYWDYNSVLNDPAAKGVDGSIQETQKFGGELNRFATHSTKAFVGELFTYAVLGELRQALPSDDHYAGRALKFYFNDYFGPMCKSLADVKRRVGN